MPQSRSPQICFGRDTELDGIVRMIFEKLGIRPARIAILGPGGYGKTTLANAVLTHPSVENHFGDARYSVACGSVFSSGALLIELAKTLGVLDGDRDTLWSRIRAVLDRTNCILCLDNVESSWDQDGHVRNSVEELLSRIAELRQTTLIIMMRGFVLPARTKWTEPHLPPLIKLDCKAVQQVWEETAGSYDSYAEELTNATDYVPLAVTLLAYCAPVTSAELLLKEWNEKWTEFIHMNQTDRVSNLDMSILLSIDSVRMRANPSAKDMLGVLSMLPDGIHLKQLERFKGILSGIDVLLGLHTLQECSLVRVIGERYQTHSIIQSFCNNHSPIPQRYKTALIKFYISLACIDPSGFTTQAGSYAEMVLEMNNTKAILLDVLKSGFKSCSELDQAITTFASFCSAVGDHSNDFISLHADILSWLGKTYYIQGAFSEAEAFIQKALKYHSLSSHMQGIGDDLAGLGAIYLH